MSRTKVRLLKSGKIYYLRYIYAGQDSKVSTKPDNQDRAENIRDQFESKLNSDSVEAYNSHILFDDLCKEYIENYAKPHLENRTWKDYISKINIIMPYLGSKPVSIIDTIIIENILLKFRKDRELKK